MDVIRRSRSRQMIALASAAGFVACHAPAQTVKYDFKVIASGERDGFDLLSQQPSVNNAGDVAFIGSRRDSANRYLENVYSVLSNEPVPRQLMNSVFVKPTTNNATTQQFGPWLQINDQRQVLTRRYHNVVVILGFPFGSILTQPITYMERWNAAQEALPTLVQMGDGGACTTSGLITFLNPATAGVYPSPFDYGTPWAGLYGDAGFNNQNHAILSGIGNCRRNNGQNIVETFTPNRNNAGLLGSLEIPRPQMADDGMSVLRLGGPTDGVIATMTSSVFPVTAITSTARGFSSAGRSPGISDDGQAIAFTGVWMSRRSLWVSFKSAGTFAAPIQIAGESGNALLEAGETWIDANSNGLVDPGEDQGPYNSFLADTRVSINRIGTSGTLYNVVFTGVDNQSRKCVFQIRVDAAAVSPVLSRATVLAAGDSVAGVTGTVLDVSNGDAVGTGGHICLWAKIGTTDVILRTGVEDQVLDYSDPQLQGQASTNANALVRHGFDRRGLVADGVTPLLIRSNAKAATGFIRIRVRDEFGSTSIPDVGTLSLAQDPTFVANPLDVPLVRVPATNELRAFARLRAPSDFVRPSRVDNGVPIDLAKGLAQPRQLFIETQYIPDNGPPEPMVTRQIELHRPPVVLVHGLEGFPTDFNWNIQSDNRFSVTLADYRDRHAIGFINNQSVVRKPIALAVRKMRDRGIACTQADVVGHSMGGLLSRLYSIGTFNFDGRPHDTGYHRADNFNLGDIHKLITVDTPHRGSPLSNLGILNDNVPTAAGQFAICMVDGPSSDNPADDKRCTTCGAVRDLRSDSLALALINSFEIPIPSHAIVGVGGRPIQPFGDPSLDSCDSYRLKDTTGRTEASANFCGLSVSSLFGGERHDLVVSESSQRGGLPSSAVTPIDGDISWHYQTVNCNPNANPAGNRVIELLNTSSSSSSFAYFPISARPPDSTIPCSPLAGILVQIAVTSPAPSTVVAPGQTVNIVVERLSTCVYSVSANVPGGQPVSSNTYPFVLPVVIPATAIGPIEISIAGDLQLPCLGGTCDFRLPLTVVPPAALQSIGFDNPLDVPLQLDRINAQSQLRVLGQYADGVARNVTTLGTVFSVSPPGVVSVTPTGRVQGLRKGSAVVTATKDALTSSVLVVVGTAKGDGDDNGSVDELDAASFRLAFTGPAGPAFSLPARQDADVFDFDEDGDIDCSDWLAMVERWSSSTAPIPPQQCACRADFNGGGLSPSDIFDFLNAWFASDPRADFNGGGLSPSDIFDFLNAWFVGC